LPLATLPAYTVNSPRRNAAVGTPTPAAGGVPHTPVHRAQPPGRARHASPRGHGKQPANPRAPY